MSDMLSPLRWETPTSRAGTAAAGATPLDETPSNRFVWPAPPYAAYPAPEEQRVPLACEILALNGRLMKGRMIFFVPEESVVHVQVPPARITMPLRFDQFRSLRLLDPLLPSRDGGQATAAHHRVLSQRPRSPYEITYGDGEEATGETVGHVLEEFGLFLFTPIEDGGLEAADAVLREFIPRPAFRSFEIGSRIGELLVDSQAATPAEVAEAVDEQLRLRTQKLGDILLTQRVLTPDALLNAIERQSQMPMVRIGEALQSLGLVDTMQLAAALAQQREDRGVPLGELLVRKGVISRQDLQTALARKMGYPMVDVAQFPCDVAAVKRVPFAVAKRLRALPLMLREGRLVVALEDPAQPQVVDELEFAAQTKIVPVLAPFGTVDDAVRIAYERAGVHQAAQLSAATAAADTIEFEAADTNKLMESLEREGAERLRSEDDKPIEQSDNSLVKLINSMIIEAAGQGVSDIHIESYPGRDKVKVRFRKDGSLQPYLELPHNYRSALIARIKIMCDLDISERRKPQDGKINFAKFSPSHKLELRVATIPTNNGLEDVVMRILASAKPIPLNKIGLSPRNLKQLEYASERPYGLILCVGPTGSGKTTTLHSALSHINVPERKIWTAEDPVEITQPGLRQVQVNPKIEWTFAKALRAFLRADPDVIMVGEIRDGETAQMAVEASLTGHLVLSTLHTNSAPETVTRLIDMGMDPFNFADSLLLVLAQRLVRKLCTSCRETRPMTEEETEELLSDYLHVCPPDDPQFERERVRSEWLGSFGKEGRLMHFHSRGCAQCNQTGQRGRAGLHEMMSISRELRRLIQTGGRAEELARIAIGEGMRTLRQDGIEKVLQGLVTIDEVRATSNA